MGIFVGTFREVEFSLRYVNVPHTLPFCLFVSFYSCFVLVFQASQCHCAPIFTPNTFSTYVLRSLLPAEEGALISGRNTFIVNLSGVLHSATAVLHKAHDSSATCLYGSTDGVLCLARSSRCANFGKCLTVRPIYRTGVPLHSRCYILYIFF
jgi:hypothetical protein